jgi:osmotically-inducible protein OsmY
MIRSDTDVQRHIEAELCRCPHVNETDIGGKVTDGIVTLSGFVRDFVDKYGAENVVKRVAGVVAVANDIQVLTAIAYGRTDPQVARAASAAIRASLPQCWERVRPLVRQGSVTLEGELDCRNQSDLIERVVRRIEGVVCVVNAIALRTAGQSAHCAEQAHPTAQIPTDSNGAPGAVSVVSAGICKA